MAAEDPPRRGRRPKPVDPRASSAARLGAEIRQLRLRRGLTLHEVAQDIRFSIAHLSAVERGGAPASEQFVLAWAPASAHSAAIERSKPAEPSWSCFLQRSMNAPANDTATKPDGGGAASYRWLVSDPRYLSLDRRQPNGMSKN
jgi:transcriptional regulator with XRE-family HTH domain